MRPISFTYLASVHSRAPALACLLKSTPLPITLQNECNPDDTRVPLHRACLVWRKGSTGNFHERRHWPDGGLTQADLLIHARLLIRIPHDDTIVKQIDLGQVSVHVRRVQDQTCSGETSKEQRTKGGRAQSQQYNNVHFGHRLRWSHYKREFMSIDNGPFQ